MAGARSRCDACLGGRRRKGNAGPGAAVRGGRNDSAAVEGVFLKSVA